MKLEELINEFQSSWSFARQLTFDFIEAVPDDKWSFSPHTNYSPLCKQFRHMIWVTGLYREALEKRNMSECESKKNHYKGDLTRDSLMKGLRHEGQIFDNLLDSLKSHLTKSYSIKAYGTEMGFSECLRCHVASRRPRDKRLASIGTEMRTNVEGVVC